jgi:hypothetical protein
MGRAGHLDIRQTDFVDIDGEKVLLRALKDEKGGSHTGAMTGAIVATSLVLSVNKNIFSLQTKRRQTASRLVGCLLHQCPKEDSS